MPEGRHKAKTVYKMWLCLRNWQSHSKKCLLHSDGGMRWNYVKTLASRMRAAGCTRQFSEHELTGFYNRDGMCLLRGRTGSLYIIQVTCFVWIWEQTAIISLYNINWLVCITETESVYCAVRTGSLYIIEVMCFVWIWEQTAIISLCSINWLVCITETECVYCAVRTRSLDVIQAHFRLWRVSDAVSRCNYGRSNKRITAIRSTWYNRTKLNLYERFFLIISVVKMFKFEHWATVVINWRGCEGSGRSLTRGRLIFRHFPGEPTEGLG